MWEGEGTQSWELLRLQGRRSEARVARQLMLGLRWLGKRRRVVRVTRRRRRLQGWLPVRLWWRVEEVRRLRARQLLRLLGRRELRLRRVLRWVGRLLGQPCCHVEVGRRRLGGKLRPRCKGLEARQCRRQQQQGLLWRLQEARRRRLELRLRGRLCREVRVLWRRRGLLDWLREQLWWRREAQQSRLQVRALRLL